MLGVTWRFKKHWCVSVTCQLSCYFFLWYSITSYSTVSTWTTFLRDWKLLQQAQNTEDIVTASISLHPETSSKPYLIHLKFCQVFSLKTYQSTSLHSHHQYPSQNITIFYVERWHCLPLFIFGPIWRRRDISMTLHCSMTLSCPATVHLLWLDMKESSASVSAWNISVSALTLMLFIFLVSAQASSGKSFHTSHFPSRDFLTWYRTLSHL